MGVPFNFKIVVCTLLFPWIRTTLMAWKKNACCIPQSLMFLISGSLLAILCKRYKECGGELNGWRQIKDFSRIGWFREPFTGNGTVCQVYHFHAERFGGDNIALGRFPVDTEPCTQCATLERGAVLFDMDFSPVSRYSESITVGVLNIGLTASASRAHMQCAVTHFN